METGFRDISIVEPFNLGTLAKITTDEQCGCPPKELYALVIAESDNNYAEAAAITAVLLNRVRLERMRSYGPLGWRPWKCPLDKAFQQRTTYHNVDLFYDWDTGLEYHDSDTWIKFIGGKKVYTAYLNTKYNTVMNTPDEDILDPAYPYAAIVRAVNDVWENYAFEYYLQQYSYGAWFWGHAYSSVHFVGVTVPNRNPSSLNKFYRYRRTNRTWP